MFHTPLIHLGKNIYAKAEYENPTGSVKDRAAWFMLQDARQRGALASDGTVIEATSGNMGIALAALCQAWGYGCIIVMPDSMTTERQQMMASFGAEVILTPGKLGMAGAEAEAARLAKIIPGSHWTRQFENQANVLAHYQTTGPEIWHQTGGKVDIFVAGVGTGGTITGTGRFLKEQNPHIKIIAVEPQDSPLLSCGKAGSHGIQGIGANFIPCIMDTALPDQILTISDPKAFAAAQELCRQGIFAGISSGANFHAARMLAQQYPGQTILTLLPDSANRYASLGL